MPRVKHAVSSRVPLKWFFSLLKSRERQRQHPRDSTWRKSPLNRKMGELRVIVCVSLPAVDSTTLVFLSFPFLFQCLPICSGTLGLHALYSAVRSAEMWQTVSSVAFFIYGILCVELELVVNIFERSLAVLFNQSVFVLLSSCSFFRRWIWKIYFVIRYVINL